MEEAFTTAVDALSSRQIMPGPESSAEWMKKLAPEMRAKAFFSARVESAGLLSRMRRELEAFLGEEVEEVEGPDGITRRALKTDGKASFIERIRNLMLKEGIASPNELPEGQGPVTEFASTTRLELIFNTITKQAHGFAEWRQSMEPAILRAFPARRFVRIPGARDPRPRHVDSEGEVRLKTDFDYWAYYQNGADIGGFEVPWEPFGFNSYMTTEDVSREEARSLGLIQEDENVEAPASTLESYLSGVQASMMNIAPTLVLKLVGSIGPIARLRGSALALLTGSTVFPATSKFKDIAQDFIEDRIDLDQAVQALQRIGDYDLDWIREKLIEFKEAGEVLV